MNLNQYSIAAAQPGLSVERIEVLGLPVPPVEVQTAILRSIDEETTDLNAAINLATRIGAIVKGERSVTADTALRLARFFGTSPEFWINLQAMHDLTKARLESGPAIERDVQPRAT